MKYLGLRRRDSAAIAASPDQDKITDGVQSELTKSFASASATAEQDPPVLGPDHLSRARGLPARRRLGVHGGLVAILLGATVVFFWFPKKDEEEALLASYRTEDSGAAVSGSPPGSLPGSPPGSPR